MWMTKEVMSSSSNGHYISSNKAMRKIFGFDIHKIHPAVLNLEVNLENGQ